MIVENSFSMSQISMQDVPTVVAVNGTDSSAFPWKETQAIRYHPDVLTGTLDYREQSLNMPGIYHPGQADRVAIQRLNYYTLINLRVSCVAFDEAGEWTIGDVIEVTHSWGLVSKPMRLISQSAIAPGRFRLELEEYDPRVFSGSIETTPSYPDTGMHAPADVPTVTGLTGSLNALTLSSQWDDMGRLYPFLVSYEVEARNAGVVDTQTTTTERQVTMSPIPLADEIAVRIHGRWAGVDYVGAWATATVP